MTTNTMNTQRQQLPKGFPRTFGFFSINVGGQLLGPGVGNGKTLEPFSLPCLPLLLLSLVACGAAVVAIV